MSLTLQLFLLSLIMLSRYQTHQARSEPLHRVMLRLVLIQHPVHNALRSGWLGPRGPAIAVHLARALQSLENNKTRLQPHAKKRMPARSAYSRHFPALLRACSAASTATNLRSPHNTGWCFLTHTRKYPHTHKCTRTLSHMGSRFLRPETASHEATHESNVHARPS